jgi:hypothetical protein
MPNWEVVSIVTALMSSVSGTTNLLRLDDGKPFSRSLGAHQVKFDGRSTVDIRSNAGNLRIIAKTPATLLISPNGSLVSHNYGNGSGQVYDLAVYRLRDGVQLTNTRMFKRKVFQFARRTSSCKIRRDQISYIVEGWSRPTVLKIRTEDWSRKSGCDHVNRSWTFRVI